MTDVFVAYASKMQGTAEIAEFIADTLRERGLEVEIEAVGAKTTLPSDAGALVAGSALYNSSWRPEMVAFLQRTARTWDDFAVRPVWLFHSGPLGDDAGTPQKLPKKVAAVSGTMGARPVKTFGGRLPDKPKGIVAKLLARRMAGDWRDFDEVRAWAGEIADALARSEAAS